MEGRLSAKQAVKQEESERDKKIGRRGQTEFQQEGRKLGKGLEVESCFGSETRKKTEGGKVLVQVNSRWREEFLKREYQQQPVTFDEWRSAREEKGKLITTDKL